MSLESITSVTQTAYDQAEAAVIAMLRYNAPNLDLRLGTVLRELLVRPAASFYALNTSQNVQQQQLSSLQTIAANPTVATPSDVNKILSNFNIVQSTGAHASGFAKITVTNKTTYYVASTYTLATVDGLVFNVAQAYTVSPTPSAGQLQLTPAADGLSFYFLLPVTAAAAGVAYQLPAGTALTPSVVLSSFVLASAYNQFTGGVDAESISTTITQLPAAISHRSLESRTSIEALLRDPNFGNFSGALQAISVQGMGDAAQLRDKHNPWGTSVGARVDVYPRNFTQPVVTVLSKAGTLVAPNSYRIELSMSDAPGYYAIRAITDIATIDTASVDPASLPSLGSYAFTEVRTANTAAVRAANHDINLSENTAVEVSGTVYQMATITVTGVPGTGATRQFKLELYTDPRLADMQTYVDALATRSVKADVLIRCPRICLVSVRASVVARLGTQVDLAAMQSALLSYINSRSFVDKLTASELLAILHQYPIMRVDMSGNTQTSFQLSGVVQDAAGVPHYLSGSTLDLAQVHDPAALLTTGTCVFGSLAERIQLGVSYE